MFFLSGYIKFKTGFWNYRYIENNYNAVNSSLLITFIDIIKNPAKRSYDYKTAILECTQLLRKSSVYLFIYHIVGIERA